MPVSDQEKKMILRRIDVNDRESIERLSKAASAITKDYYDPIIGPEQNDYMIGRSYTASVITKHITEGHNFYAMEDNEDIIGFIDIYPRGNALYLNKFYMREDFRGMGLGSAMLDFVKKEARRLELPSIELNMNRFNPTAVIYERLGFRKIREEKIDIGSGYYMDDFVYSMTLD